MEKLEVSTVSKKREQIVPLVIIFILSLLFTWFMSTISGDDLSYLDRLNTMGYIKASIDHYNTWSSRIIIEVALMFFSKNFMLWRIANALIMTGTVWFLTKYTSKELNAKNLFLSFGLYCMVPLNIMRETGWVATTLNYHWAIFFALVAFYPFYLKLNNKKISVSIYIFSLLALIYAANQEQIALCYLMFVLLISLYLLKIKNFDWKLSLFSIISLIGMILFFVSPGNTMRTNAEMQLRFPEFANYSVINKLDLGISSFGKPFFFDANVLMFMLFALVAFLAYKKTANYYIRFIAVTPLAFNFIIYLGGTMKMGFDLYPSNYSSSIFLVDKLDKWFFSTGTNLSLHYPGTWIPTLIVLGLLLCLMVGLFFSFDNLGQKLIAILLLLMGFFARVLMGFSPTVWASGLRTYVVTFFVVAILVLLLLNELKKFLQKRDDGLILFLSVCGICTLFLTMLGR